MNYVDHTRVLVSPLNLPTPSSISCMPSLPERKTLKLLRERFKNFTF